MDLSIIIPVYNTKPQDLARCFDSVCTFGDISYEVILVDDGSEAETAQFCRSYAQQHPQFCYVRQENQGVSSARNTGLQQAQGKYVLFADADDEVLAGGLQKQDFQTDAQILFYDFELIEAGHVRKWKLFSRKEAADLEKKVFFAAACENRLNSAWSKLYQRELLVQHGITFDRTMVFGEDAKFVFRTITAAEKARYTGRVLYRYHHDFGNGDRRLARFPERVIGNSVMLYDLRRKTLEMPEIRELYSPSEYQRLTVVLRDRVVRDLFEAAGSLRLMGKYTQNLNRRIQPLAAELYAQYGGRFSAVTKIKCLLLAEERAAAIWLLAFLREIYIRIRR